MANYNNAFAYSGIIASLFRGLCIREGAIFEPLVASEKKQTIVEHSNSDRLMRRVKSSIQPNTSKYDLDPLKAFTKQQILAEK